MIRTIAVLGGGTAGLLAALTLRRKFPDVSVRVIHSKDIGIIGVGEGTTPLFPRHLFETLQVDAPAFFAGAQPTWKLGIRFLWGPRPEFYYSFTPQFDARWSDLPRAHGFYCDEEYRPADLAAALMAAGKCAPRRLDGTPDFLSATALHIENARLVAWLDAECRKAGIEFTEGTVADVTLSEDTISSLTLASGAKVSADLFVDASGFRSELVGRAFAEPFEDWSDVLFCDRAVIGGWERTDEPILPYTTAETMDAGWAWQIEHEHFINRGYVYSSAHLDDDAARAEHLRKNPRIREERTRVVKFRSGKIRRPWTANAVAIGNAAGFVEPLEATALSVLVLSVRALADALADAALEPTPAHVAAYNRYTALAWVETRDFLALHYKFNTRLDTPFWRHARDATPLGTIEPLVDFFRDAGPAQFARNVLESPDNIYQLEGHLALLIGQQVPYRKKHAATGEERGRWQQHCADFAAKARIGLTVAECLAAIRGR